MTEANSSRAEQETLSPAGRLLDKIKLLAPLKTPDSLNPNTRKARSARFEYYENINPFSGNVPILVEYLPVGISQDNGYLRGQIIEMLVARTSPLDFSVSRIICAITKDRKMHVYTRIDTEISGRIVSGEIPQKVIRQLPEDFIFDPKQAAERELTDEEIEQELIKAEKLSSRQIKRRD